MSGKFAQNKGKGRKKNEEMDEILAKTEDFAHYIFTRQDKARQSNISKKILKTLPHRVEKSLIQKIPKTSQNTHKKAA